MFYAGQGRLDFSFLQNVRSSSSSQELHTRPTQDCAEKSFKKAEPDTLSTSNQSLSGKSPEEESGVRFELVVTTIDEMIMTTVSVLYNEEGYPVDLPEFPFPAIDRCECKSEKPDTIYKATQCLICTRFVCMIKGCKKNYPGVSQVTLHQRRDHTDEELKQFVLYKFTHCICGEIRKRKPGISIQTCPFCSRLLCSLGKCFSVVKDSHVHLELNCWFVESDYKDKCSKCKQPKVRDGQTIATKCPKEGCKTFWCLYNGCHYESESMMAVHLHQGATHLMFRVF